MPARRKSAAELALSGATKKNRKRYEGRNDAHDVAELGYAPRLLSASQKIIWREIVQAAPKGLLTAADEFIVELAARLVERVRSGVPKPSEVNVLIAVLGKLGMTPTDRQRLSIPTTQPPAETDPWDALDAPIRTGVQQ